ncbi:MAG: TldD/PmbA family protein [Acidobacteria bacterium]|nr:TldD/PmbA family protein [Acidobacteriota bacterium]
MSDAIALADQAVSVLSGMKLEAEIYLEDNSVTSVCVAGGKTESLELKEERGAGIRIFDGGRVGFAHTADLSAQGIRDAAAAARSFAAHTDPDAANRLPAIEASAVADPDPGDLAIGRLEAYRKAAIARAMEEAARAVDPRITRVRQARYTDVVGRVEIRSTSGVSRGAPFARVYGSIELHAEENGESQSGYATDYALRFSSLDPFKIGREAARKALAKLGATRPATRRTDIVFTPEVTGDLLEAFMPALGADNVLKGKSIFAGKIGGRIASPIVDLVDDGRFPGGNRTFPFDGEGNATRRNVLVEGGILRGYLHNAYTSTKMSCAPTGNAFRPSYSGPPRISPNMIYFVPQAATREEILSRVKSGFCISEVMGLHTVDPITGEFSLGAFGQAIENGALTHAVTGIGFAGTVSELLSNVEGVASDLRMLPSGSGGSTLLVRSVSISGT